MWPMFSEARYVFVYYPVVFRLENVDNFFQCKNIAACYEIVCIQTGLKSETLNFARQNKYIIC